MAPDRRDYIPDFGSDDEESEEVTDGLRNGLDTQSYRIQPSAEGIEVNIYFPADEDEMRPPEKKSTRPTKPPEPPPQETRPHEYAFPDDPPTRPSVRPTELEADDEQLSEDEDEPAENVVEQSLPSAASVAQPRSSRMAPILLLGVITCIALTSLIYVAYQADRLPPQVAALIPRSASGAMAPTMPPTSTEGELLQPTDSPTQRITETPAVGVTPIVATEEAEATPTRRATATQDATVTDEPDTEEDRVIQGGALMVSVPGGTFSMGSTERGNEAPIHDVTLDPYYIDVFEVTNGAWATCVQDGACEPPADTNAYDGSPYYGESEFDDYPVIYVSWYNAEAYCSWRGARLPTEAEWEMAARWEPETDSVRMYPWGDQWDRTRLNYCDSSCLLTDATFKDLDFDDGWAATAPVGSFPTGASPVGALDMAGNVAEWVADWYDGDYYADSPSENPMGPDSGEGRGVRGGGWTLDQEWNRGSARSFFGALFQVAGVGFRCAIDADQVNP